VSDTVSLQAGYLLHHRQYGDTNFIVDFFSLDHGRIPLIAKGARSSKPRTRALYQPFRPLLISWWGNQELRTLTGIEESGASLSLEGAALPCGYYLNEIILRLLQKDQPQPTLFAHYSLALSQLADYPDNPEPVLRSFELQLLETLGLLPDFARCRNDGESISDEEQFLFYPGSNQAVLVPHDDSQYIAIPKKKTPEAVYHSDGETIDVGVPVSGRTLNKLANFDIDDDKVLSEIKPLMRRLLRMHLGDKPLNSRELFSSLTPPPPPPLKKHQTDTAGTSASPEHGEAIEMPNNSMDRAVAADPTDSANSATTAAHLDDANKH